MGLYRRGKIFWFTIMQGKRMQVSTKTDNRKLAEHIFAQSVTEIREGEWFEKRKPRQQHFEEMTEKYLQKYCKTRDEHTVKRYSLSLVGLMLAEITTEMVSDYREDEIKDC